MNTRHLSGLCFLATALTGLVLPVSADIVTNAPPLPAQNPGDWDALKITWTKPEAESSQNGIPIGNNFVAARGMWDTQICGAYLPLGTLYLKFDHGDQAQNYLRTLDLDRALSTVRYDINGVTYTREAFATFPDRVIVLRLTASQKGKLTFTTSLAYPPEMEGHGASVATEGDHLLVMKGKAPAHLKKWSEPQGMTFQSRLYVKPTGGKILAGADHKTLRVEAADSVLLIFADATSYAGPFKEPGTEGVDPKPLVKATLAAAAKSYDQLLAACALAAATRSPSNGPTANSSAPASTLPSAPHRSLIIRVSRWTSRTTPA